MAGLDSHALHQLRRAGAYPVADEVLADVASLAAPPPAAAAALGCAYERRLAENRSRRRAAGSYYTPEALVSFLVEESLGQRLRGLSGEDALRLRVLDPSSGAGAFLLAALERLFQHCRERLPGVSESDLLMEIATNCITGVDIDRGAAAVAKLALAVRCGRPGEFDIRTGDALLGHSLGDGERFDVVLGNPPWGQKGFRFSAEDGALLRRRYRTATGPLDPFKLFLERAIELTAVGGRWALALPDILLLKNQQPARDLVLETSAIEQIVDVGQAFADVNLDAILVVGRRTDRRPPEDHRIRAATGIPPATSNHRTIPQRWFLEMPEHKFNLHLTEASLTLLRTLNSHPRLGDRFEAHEGVHTGNCRSKLFVSASTPAPRAPVVVGGKELRPYQLAWGGTYLNLDPAAVDRAAGEYANLGRPEWHEREKLVVRRTGDYIMAAFDPNGHYVSNNLFVVVPKKPMTSEELRATAVVLNSRLMTWYFRTVQPRTGRLFAELKLCHLRDFPLPKWPSSELVGTLAAMESRGRRVGHSEADLSRVDQLVELDLFQLDAGEREQVANLCKMQR